MDSERSKNIKSTAHKELVSEYRSRLGSRDHIPDDRRGYAFLLSGMQKLVLIQKLFFIR